MLGLTPNSCTCPRRSARVSRQATANILPGVEMTEYPWGPERQAMEVLAGRGAGGGATDGGLRGRIARRACGARRGPPRGRLEPGGRCSPGRRPRAIRLPRRHRRRPRRAAGARAGRHCAARNPARRNGDAAANPTAAPSPAPVGPPPSPPAPPPPPLHRPAAAAWRRRARSRGSRASPSAVGADSVGRRGAHQPGAVAGLRLPQRPARARVGARRRHAL